MSKAIFDGEARLQKYLTGAGLRVERFTKAEMQQGRTPDFRVFAGDELAFYCEVKTAREDEWLDRQLAAAPTVDAGGRFAPGPHIQPDQQLHSQSRGTNSMASTRRWSTQTFSPSSMAMTARGSQT